jgi:polyphosphate glucokinase
MLAMGVDIGGSGIKGAIVDTAKGTLASERVRIPTPDNAEAPVLIGILQDLLDQFEWTQGPVGIGFPGVIRHNVIGTAANLNDSLIGVNLADALKSAVTGPVRVLNDADAAGFAEMRFGEGLPYAREGTVLLLTIGTGIGTVLFTDGVLYPNLEFGHVEFNGTEAEHYVSERVRKREDLSWKRWSKRFNDFLQYTESLLQPDLIILGGGGVKKADRFSPHIDIRTPWKLARSGNLAGIIGSALAAADL